MKVGRGHERGRGFFQKRKFSGLHFLWHARLLFRGPLDVDTRVGIYDGEI